MNRILKSVLALLLFAGFAFFLHTSGERLEANKIKEGIAQEFSGTISSISRQRGALCFSFKSGRDFSKYILDSEMDSLGLDDSVVKKKGENICTVYKRNGRTLKVKFIYINAMYK